MKKFLTILFMLIVLSGCSKKSLEYDEMKEDIIYNIENISKKANDQLDYDYTKNKYFKKIVSYKYDAVNILLNLYYENEMSEVSEYVAAFAIQEITNCNIFETYGLNWDTPDEFFEIWKNNNCSYKDNYLNNNIDELLEKYKEFSEVMKECKINLPIFKDMIPQGITIMKDYILITAYDNEGKKNSSCYVLQKNGEIVNIVTLDTNSHVGSIDYDSRNDLILIPGNSGRLNVYSGKEFLEKNEVKAKWRIDNLSDGLLNYRKQGKNEIAYLTMEDGYLYIGSFSVFQNGTVKKYEISNENDNLKLNFLQSFKVPSKVQGITFYEKNGYKYMMLSRSYGRYNASYLNVFQYDESVTDYSSNKSICLSLKLPPMLEQINLKDNLYSIFESNAKKYDNCLEKVSNVCILNEEKILNKFLIEQEKKLFEQEQKEKIKKNDKSDKKNKVRN